MRLARDPSGGLLFCSVRIERDVSRDAGRDGAAFLPQLACSNDSRKLPRIREHYLIHFLRGELVTPAVLYGQFLAIFTES